MVNFEPLITARDRIAVQFANGDPIRHVTIDDFLNPVAAKRALDAFPSVQAMEIAFAGLAEVKSADQAIDRLDPIFGSIFDELHSQRFVQWLSGVTRVPGLIGDVDLHGGGLHQGTDGSYLDVHADFNIHPKLSLYRRLNLLIYLNHTWERQWQGYLELWSRDMLECRAEIEPKFNRCVIMETHDHAYHGYKELRLPQGTTRKSLASYYYSAERSDAQAEVQHDTLFQLRPDQRRATGARQLARRLIALAPPPLRPLARAIRRVLSLD
ncbi:MAG: 2OG-Fe(II) oxygenase [Candidatus Eremiobacteraeota bacterium]|nr:2OG-Fe(II) oxygenase [Candidatus Eremiobacteraeota bacterium]